MQSDINYNFRANALTPRFWRKKHLEKLADPHASLFDDIDIDALKVDHEAVNILTSACETIAIALEHSEHSDKPVYLALGERHPYSAHKIHHMLAIKGLIASGKNISVGLEADENYRKFMFMNDVSDYLEDDFDKDIVEEYYDKENLALTSGLMEYKYRANYAEGITEYFLSQQQQKINLPVKLTDAPCLLEDYHTVHRGRTPYLDVNDPFIAARSDGKTNIYSTDVDGLNIRNQHMVEKIPRADIMVQIVGSFHVVNTYADACGVQGNKQDMQDQTLVHNAKDAGYEAVGRMLLMPLPWKFQDTHWSSLDPEYWYYATDGMFDRVQGAYKTLADQENLFPAKSISFKKFGSRGPRSFLGTPLDDKERRWVDTKLQRLGMGDVIESYQDIENSDCSKDKTLWDGEYSEELYGHLDAIRELVIEKRTNNGDQANHDSQSAEPEIL